MQSTLFLHYITCVDHAYIDARGNVTGGSYHPNFEVTGEVESQENVVVDFSRVKKEIKGAIDDKELGFDHKLWIIPGLSKASYAINDTEQTILIQTPTTTLRMPRNAVKLFEHEFVQSLDRTFETEANAYLTDVLSKLHPDLNITVKTQNTSTCFSHSATPFMFRYAHGLKNSSSWGCQNHSHGHLSWFEFEFDKDRQQSINWDELDRICAEIDNTLFLFDDNITHDDKNFVTIAYTTPRGDFEATYKREAYKIQVFQTETTIEHIAEWFKNRYGPVLAESGVNRIFISEGLAKGAVVSL